MGTPYSKAEQLAGTPSALNPIVNGPTPHAYADLIATNARLEAEVLRLMAELAACTRTTGGARDGSREV